MPKEEDLRNWKQMGKFHYLKHTLSSSVSTRNSNIEDHLWLAFEIQGGNQLNGTVFVDGYKLHRSEWLGNEFIFKELNALNERENVESSLSYNQHTSSSNPREWSSNKLRDNSFLWVERDRSCLLWDVGGLLVVVRRSGWSPKMILTFAFDDWSSII